MNPFPADNFSKNNTKVILNKECISVQLLTPCKQDLFIFSNILCVLRHFPKVKTIVMPIIARTKHRNIWILFNCNIAQKKGDDVGRDL